MGSLERVRVDKQWALAPSARAAARRAEHNISAMMFWKFQLITTILGIRISMTVKSGTDKVKRI